MRLLGGLGRGAVAGMLVDRPPVRPERDEVPAVGADRGPRVRAGVAQADAYRRRLRRTQRRRGVENRQPRAERLVRQRGGRAPHGSVTNSSIATPPARRTRKNSVTYCCW